jgi:hypothetical protein
VRLDETSGRTGGQRAWLWIDASPSSPGSAKPLGGNQQNPEDKNRHSPIDLRFFAGIQYPHSNYNLVKAGSYVNVRTKFLGLSQQSSGQSLSLADQVTDTAPHVK